MSDKILDPSFHMPPEVAGLRYSEPDEFDEFDDSEFSEEVDSSTDVEFSGSDVESDDATSDDNTPYPPDYMEIVSQTVRTLSGGGQVVDVVVELPDLDDGGRYETRLTKV